MIALSCKSYISMLIPFPLCNSPLPALKWPVETAPIPAHSTAEGNYDGRPY